MHTLAPRPKETATETLPVLVVDDEPDARKIMARLLAAFGYQADVAPDGPTALRLVEQKQYGLAILDYQMPGMNGIQLFKHIHRARPEMRGIFLTSNTSLEVVRPALEAGVLRVFPKPVDFRELMPVVEEQVQQASVEAKAET